MQIFRIALLAILTLLLNLPKTATAQEGIHLSLQSAIAIALQNTPQLRAAHSEISAAKGRGWTIWWLADPGLSVEWEGVPRGAGLNQFAERRITLSQKIDFPTNIFWRNRLAGRETEVAEMRSEQIKIEIRAVVVTAYFRYLAARERLLLARRRVSLAQEFADKALFRYQAGEAPAIETVRTGVELARAQNELQSKQSAFESATARLNAAFGRPPDTGIGATDSLIYRSFDLSLPDIKDQALGSHPQLGEADARVGAAANLRKLAWGTLLPTFEISGFQQNIAGNPDFYGVEVGLSIPLWFAFRQRGEIRQATASLASQENQHEQIRLQLLTDIEAAYSSFKAAKNQLENYATTLLKQADEVYRIALRSYEEGEVGYLQLLEAQQTLIEVRQGHIEALANYYSAIAALEEAGAVIILR